jgi:uncharacterized protein YecT (DUF1311 family)
MKKIFLLTLLLISIHSANGAERQCDDTKMSNAAYGNCLSDVNIGVERKLKMTFSKFLKEQNNAESEDSTIRHKNAAERAQRAWRAYREAECDFVIIQFEEGTFVSRAYFECMLKFNRARIQYLGHGLRTDVVPQKK